MNRFASLPDIAHYFTDPTRADLALVVERFADFYRAATCLALDMAYNNARQLARPDRDWLAP